MPPQTRLRLRAMHGHPLSGNNTFMPQVSIYVAVITAAAGVLGAAVPQIATLARDVRQAERDRRERSADAKRQASIELLRAASNFRTQMVNTVQSHGEQIEAQLARVREYAEAVGLHAVGVGLLSAEPLSGPAQELAAAADRLAATALENLDMRVMAIVPKPEYTEFDESVAAFRQVAIATARE